MPSLTRSQAYEDMWRRPNRYMSDDVRFYYYSAPKPNRMFPSSAGGLLKPRDNKTGLGTWTSPNNSKNNFGTLVGDISRPADKGSSHIIVDPSVVGDLVTTHYLVFVLAQWQTNTVANFGGRIGKENPSDGHGKIEWDATNVTVTFNNGTSYSVAHKNTIAVNQYELVGVVLDLTNAFFHAAYNTGLGWNLDLDFTVLPDRDVMRTGLTIEDDFIFNTSSSSIPWTQAAFLGVQTGGNLPDFSEQMRMWYTGDPRLHPNVDPNSNLLMA